MDRRSFEKYELNEEKERSLWDDSIVIFDTSALIDFYNYPKETRQDIFNKIFTELRGRLWIPNHVQFEYLKNRRGIIEKPILEKYLPIKEEKLEEIKAARSKISTISEQIKKDTLKPEKHPFLAQEKIDEFIEFTKEINEKVKAFETDLLSEIKLQEDEILSLKENDTILSAFEENIVVGEEFSYSDILEIVSEGKLRYEFKIPPGYEDLNEKIGTQIFGDLIIWKQILSHSKKVGKSVIFICNDLKLDWCYKDSRKRIERPREELIKEFFDNNQRDFWMYDQSQFLYKAKEFLNVDFEEAKIEEVSNVINDRNKNYDLVYKCGYCDTVNRVPGNEFELDYEEVGSYERSMGTENHYQSEEVFNCINCGGEINVLLELWEYPLGAYNYEEIHIGNGVIIESPDLASHFWDLILDIPDEDMFRDR